MEKIASSINGAGKLDSHVQKNETMPLGATWMDPEMIILSEASQTEKDRYHMTSLIHGIQFKNDTYLQ